MKYWCHNAKTGEIFSYIEAEGITDFPRGTFLAYGNYLTTGFKTKEKAIEYSKDHGYCEKCKDSTTFPICFRCHIPSKQIEFKE